MRKGKTKSSQLQGKNPPLNINISFNINPKNILHQGSSADVKFASHGAFQQINHPAKNKNSKQKGNKYESNQAEAAQKLHKMQRINSIVESQMSKRQLQRIKKKVLNKINNMDIMLMPPPNSKKEEFEQQDEKQSSLMSAKMPQYQQKDTFQISNTNAKSKILNNEVSKILPVMSFKKSKMQQKPMITQSRNFTHMKGFSTFTDIKGSPERYSRKKARTTIIQGKTKVKQQNLQQKLNRFKVDMMKLAMVYDESQVLKTKFSSEYHNNIRSRQVSKDIVDVGKISQGEQHQKMEEIKQLTTIRASCQLTPKEQSQSFKHLKDVYQDLNKKKLTDLQQRKQPTQNIVGYYSRITAEQKHTYDQFIFEQSQVSSDSLSSNPQISNTDKKEMISLPQQSNLAKKDIDYEQFINFLQMKMEKPVNGAKLSQQFKGLLQEYKKAHKQRNQDEIAQQQKHKGNSIRIQNIKVGSIIDEQINKELQSITNLKEDLVENYQMNGDQIFQLQIWEQNYKNELLKIKGKMWRQYKTIESVVQSRITGNSQQQVIETRKTRKQNRIMKCLSQQYLNKHSLYYVDQPIQPLPPPIHRVLPKVQQQQPFVSREDEHLSVQVSLSDQNSEQHGELQIEGAGSNQLINALNQENFLMDNLIKVQMNQAQPMIGRKQQTISQKHKLTSEDKQDIFQFIFLDICIQLYQEAIQNQQKAHSKAKVAAAQRILQSIKNYISNQKKKKNEKQKKIGISTTVSTIKKVVEQMNQFINSDIKINNSLLTNKQRVTQKLNLPLGPSQAQILKSLRLSLYSNQPVDDYGQDMEEADLLVLQPQLFIYFESEIVKIQELPFSKYYEDEKRDEQRINFLRNCTHIHQKAIFDCINQNLDYHRIYGIWGKPFIWKKSSLFHHKIKQKDLERALSKTGGEVIKCAAFVCGLMVSKEDSLIKDIAGDANYVRKLQDERIYKLLQNFVLQMEQKWFFHDDEQSEILIELSHIVWTLLIKEVIKQLGHIMLK